MGLSELGRSDAMIGSADVFNSAPWLAQFVQFFVSWAVIIGFLMYYFSYLCTLVYLSNKEFFNQVDAVKSGGESGGDGGRMSIKGFMKAFNTDKTQKRLTGIDNIVVFVMMISPNFKAYSMYAGVDSASGGGTGAEGDNKGFSAQDTMGQFFLKALPQSVLVMFILGMAISGLLLRILFQLSDVLTIQAERFAQSNLQVWVEKATGGLRDDFWFAHDESVTGELAAKVAQDAMVQIRGHVPDMSAEHLEIARQAIETEITDNIFADINNTLNVGRLIEAVEKAGGGQVTNDPRWKGDGQGEPGGKAILTKSHETANYADVPFQTGFAVSTTVRGGAAGDPNASFSINLQTSLGNSGTAVILQQPWLNVYVTYDRNRLRQTGGAGTATTPANNVLNNLPTN